MKLIINLFALLGVLAVLLLITSALGIDERRLYYGNKQQEFRTDEVIAITKTILSVNQDSNEVTVEKLNNVEFQCILKQESGEKVFTFDTSPSIACLKLIARMQAPHSAK